MIVSRTVDRFLIVALPIAIFVYLSIGAAFQLKVEPPPEFLRGEPDWGPKRKAAEEQMARAYWKCSIDVIGSRYGFGQDLPFAAPAEFKIDEPRLAALSPKAAEDASARYWQKLRQVWILPYVWEKHYQWSTSWIGKSLPAVHDSIDIFMDLAKSYPLFVFMPGGVLVWFLVHRLMDRGKGL